MGNLSYPRKGVVLFIAATLALAQGCAILPFYKHPNREAKRDPVAPAGTYNASLVVPWDYDFTRVDEARAAECRRFLVAGSRPTDAPRDPCAGIPRDRNFVALTLSGGGARSAALSAAIMWELGRLGILKHVDVISGVSGGAQTAALYALTRDRADASAVLRQGDRYVFDSEDPSKFVSGFERNLTVNWLLSLLMPWHLGAYLVTYFDRTDVMADTLADNYYPRGSWLDINWGMRFRDLNPKRPNLLINAVDMTMRLRDRNVPRGIAGKCFPIVFETLRTALGSDFHRFPLAQAAMASSAYPALFQYVSLRDFKRRGVSDQPIYVHLADGGIRDHLALVPINAMLRRFAEGRPLSGLRYEEVIQACEFSRGSRSPSSVAGKTADRRRGRLVSNDRPRVPKKILVIAIDGAKPPTGIEETDADPRSSLLDFSIPVTNIIDSIDTTLDDQRMLRAAELVELRRYMTGKKATERAIQKCLSEIRRSTTALMKCVAEIEAIDPDKRAGVFGRDCCPVIGFGVHNFTKYASEEFGPINAGDLDSDKPWGMDQITLECLEDNDYGRGKADSLYADMRRMSIGLSLTPDQLVVIRKAARALVRGMIDKFCDPKTKLLAGVEGIACVPAAVPRTASCRN